MARYIGPKSKVSRKFNESIFGPCKQLKDKAYPPGVHGRNKRRKQSEYAVQLSEKQKVKYIYGLLERQFRNTFDKAASKSGVTGTNLLRYLEARLDNTVYRLGMAPTRRAARQLVGHGHIAVNGNPVNIPSYQLRPGDIVSIREASKEREFVKSNLAGRQITRYPWLEWDYERMAGKFLSYPERSDIPEPIKEQLIVELYSK